MSTFKLTLVFPLILLLIEWQTESSAVSVSQFGDVLISNDGRTWRCDLIYCPANTYRCHVQKYNSPNNMAVIIRKNVCYSYQNAVLKEYTTQSAAQSMQKISLNVDNYSNGVTSSSSSTSSASNLYQMAFRNVRSKPFANIRQLSVSSSSNALTSSNTFRSSSGNAINAFASNSKNVFRQLGNLFKI